MNATDQYFDFLFFWFQGTEEFIENPEHHPATQLSAIQSSYDSGEMSLEAMIEALISMHVLRYRFTRNGTGWTIDQQSFYRFTDKTNRCICAECAEIVYSQEALKKFFYGMFNSCGLVNYSNH